MRNITRIKHLKVTLVNWHGHLKRLQLKPGNISLTVPLSACISKGDRVRLERGDAWVACKNGEAKILVPYVAQETIKMGGLKLEVLVKEITTKEEHDACEALTNFHYRSHVKHGRTARLIVRSFHPLCPQVIGYIELATPFYMNKARAAILDAPFEFGKIRWKQWNIPSLRKYLHLFVRIARVVVSPEFRGLGVGQILVKHAAEFARNRWQVAGYLPYFIEISADMLKYVPFAEKAGMVYVGKTEGNLSRVAKDMRYLIGRFGTNKRGKSNFEKSSGICDQQIARMDRAIQLMKRHGMSVADLTERLSRLSKRTVLRDFALFHNIVALPKPHYIKGLNEYASRFLEQRIAILASKNGDTPPTINIYPIFSPIRLKDLSITYVTQVRRTIATNAVQQAFGISPDEIRTIVIRDLSLTINPGEILLIIGSSGSGKTTLLDSLVRRGKVASNVQIDGKIDIPDNTRFATFQPIRSRKPLIEALGSRDVRFGLYLMGLAGLSEAFLYLKRFNELSKGQQYRAMLARMIASRCNVWVADEFCTNLDPITANIVAHNVQKTARNLGASVIAGAPHCDSFVMSFKPDKVLLLTSTWEYSIASGNDFCKAISTNPKRDGHPPILRLFSELISAVRENRKQAVVRIGWKDYKTGFMLLESDKERLPVQVTRVVHKRFNDLTDEDAKADGLGRLSALKGKLGSIYPRIEINSPVTIVHFEPVCGGIPNAN